ncbi:hypothetical protein [Streptomyces sp. McG3]|uniref:hypothetical protein n=1 Tax=Streptomyces sp. McG3 TaxID=2725483 RepID=UPI001BEA1C52|nr:hypothetical protein [Streptomyces sp. McG3]
MITLMLIGLLGGLITAVSPCIPPVLPVVFLAGGSGRGERGEAVGKPVRAPGDTEDGGGRPGAFGGAVATAPPKAPGRPPRNRRPYAVVAGLQAYVLTFG